MIVDVHAHYFPAAYAERVEPLGLAGLMWPPPTAGMPVPSLPRREEDTAARLAAMDAAGVSRQILSIIHAPYLTSADEAVALARLGNDLFAHYCAQSPDRFSFWASLPLPHVDHAVAEATRALDELGAVGITLQCFCMGESIARREFDPLYAELDRRGAVVFLHPCQNALLSPLVGDHGLTVCAGASMEDAVAAMHLIVARIPERFPRIRFIVPHFGGILPMLLERLDGQLRVPHLAEPPSVTARRFFYDTVGWGSRAALLAAREAFGAERLVPGSDWPILLGWESYTRTFDHIRQSGLAQSEIEQILHRNVPLLMGDAIDRGCACHRSKSEA